MRRELQLFDSERERSSSKHKAKLMSGTELGRKYVDGVRETVETSDMGSCGPGGVSVYLCNSYQMEQELVTHPHNQRYNFDICTYVLVLYTRT